MIYGHKNEVVNHLTTGSADDDQSNFSDRKVTIRPEDDAGLVPPYYAALTLSLATPVIYRFPRCVRAVAHPVRLVLSELAYFSGTRQLANTLAENMTFYFPALHNLQGNMPSIIAGKIISGVFTAYSYSFGLIPSSMYNLISLLDDMSRALTILHNNQFNAMNIETSIGIALESLIKLTGDTHDGMLKDCCEKAVKKEIDAIDKIIKFGNKNVSTSDLICAIKQQYNLDNLNIIDPQSRSGSLSLNIAAEFVKSWNSAIAKDIFCAVNEPDHWLKLKHSMDVTIPSILKNEALSDYINLSALAYYYAVNYPVNFTILCARSVWIVNRKLLYRTLEYQFKKQIHGFYKNKKKTRTIDANKSQSEGNKYHLNVRVGTSQTNQSYTIPEILELLEPDENRVLFETTAKTKTDRNQSLQEISSSKQSSQDSAVYFISDEESKYWQDILLKYGFQKGQGQINNIKRCFRDLIVTEYNSRDFYQNKMVCILKTEGGEFPLYHLSHGKFGSRNCTTIIFGRTERFVLIAVARHASKKCEASLYQCIWRHPDYKAPRKLSIKEKGTILYQKRNKYTV